MQDREKLESSLGPTLFYDACDELFISSLILQGENMLSFHVCILIITRKRIVQK